MDWITLRREEVENDRMPPVCVHCGAEATGRHNQTYEWCPGWVRWLYLLGVLPGAIARSFLTRRMRVSLPVCPAHNAPSKTPNESATLGRVVLIGLGTLLFLLLGVLSAPYLLGSGVSDPGWPVLIVGGTLGGLVGLMLMSAVVLLSAQSTEGPIVVEEITDDGISLVGVHSGFVRAMRDMRQGAGLGTIPMDETESPPRA